MMQESFLFDSDTMNMYFVKTLLMTACLHIHGRLNAVSLIMCEKSFSVKFESMLSIKGNDGYRIWMKNKKATELILENGFGYFYRDFSVQ